MNLDDWLSIAQKQEYPAYAKRSQSPLPAATPSLEKTHDLTLDPGRRVGVARWKACIPLLISVYITVGLLTLPHAYEADLIKVVDLEGYQYHSLLMLLVLVAVPTM